MNIHSYTVKKVAMFIWDGERQWENEVTRFIWCEKSKFEQSTQNICDIKITHEDMNIYSYIVKMWRGKGVLRGGMWCAGRGVLRGGCGVGKR